MIDRHELLATNIYHSLRAYVEEPEKRFILDGFNDGKLIFRGKRKKRLLEISSLSEVAEDKFLYERHLEMGFTEEEIAKGLWRILDIPENYFRSTWRSSGKYTIIGNVESENRWKIVNEETVQGGGKYKIVDSYPEYIDAIRHVIYLSSIPFIIAEEFQTYDNFEQTLRKQINAPSFRGISGVEWNNRYDHFILYSGSLRSWVETAKKIIHGDRITDSSEITLAKSVTGVDHFKLIEDILSRPNKADSETG